MTSLPIRLFKTCPAYLIVSYAWRLFKVRILANSGVESCNEFDISVKYNPNLKLQFFGMSNLTSGPYNFHVLNNFKIIQE